MEGKTKSWTIKSARELSKAKFSVFKLIFVPILTYDYESCSDRKSAITSASGQNKVFEKGPWSYITGQSAKFPWLINLGFQKEIFFIESCIGFCSK